MLVHLYDVLAVVGVAIESLVRLARRSGSSDGAARRREPRSTLGKEVL
jgi:hypothetical protein